ncbi:metallophosphoesterase family protein [Methylobacterium sp. 13MFTsu3.1M2]|uniref:metallophosphoesterase family protein n=1 Tax=Methylobacterium sp. 13MFTsu3.1M2 TaxID=1502776 RepID=UPI0008F11223|nr:metallophosphoesterase family protein [Methylobacterium sp. 13MFTsu3.1M2]SFE09780.1 Calcineurin-like phosphoesterase superfamily domain-containing protein [Methylobacterium sp. 13MFTsu3.1M2]
MRLLAISDIHGKVESVRRLRKRVTNGFDAIVLAGDIGKDFDTATQVFDILGSFDCPILYVFGNWDHSLPYDHDFGPNAHHLHNACVTLDGWKFAGFSGIDVNWGHNPLAASITVDLDARYEAGFAEIDGQIEALERTERETLAACEALPPLPNKAHLRPVWPLRRRLGTLREKRKQLEPALQAEYREGYKEIAAANRREMVDRMSPHPQDRTIVVTHGRLARTAQDMPDVPLFLFGHAHGFTDTRMGRSRFVNVSALDHVVPVLPEGETERHIKHLRSVDLGAYTVIEIVDQIVATSHRMRPVPEGWKQVSGFGFQYKALDQGT